MFKTPFSFKGRIRRTEYGLSYLIYVAFSFISEYISLEVPNFETISLVVWIPLLWFLIAQGAKRCHDRDNSGWYQIIPFYGLWMLFADGDPGANQYGPNPKGIGNFEEIDQIGKIENE